MLNVLCDAPERSGTARDSCVYPGGMGDHLDSLPKHPTVEDFESNSFRFDFTEACLIAMQSSCNIDVCKMGGDNTLRQLRQLRQPTARGISVLLVRIAPIFPSQS